MALQLRLPTTHIYTSYAKYAKASPKCSKNIKIIFKYFFLTFWLLELLRGIPLLGGAVAACFVVFSKTAERTQKSVSRWSPGILRP